MRTTITLDDDVAARLTRLRKTQNKSLTTIVKEALRQGLKQMTSIRPGSKRYKTKTADFGRCLVGSLDDVTEVLSIAEAESFS